MATSDERLPEDVANVLRQAGWFPGRRVDSDVDAWRAALDRSGGLEMFPAAREALREFGGLEVEQRGRGETCAKEPFHFNPLSAMNEDDRFSEWSEVIGTRLYPLGEAAQNNYYLAIDELGRVFLVEAEMILLGQNIGEALIALVRGVLGKRVNPDAHGELILSK